MACGRAPLIGEADARRLSAERARRLSAERLASIGGQPTRRSAAAGYSLPGQYTRLFEKF